MRSYLLLAAILSSCHVVISGGNRMRFMGKKLPRDVGRKLLDENAKLRQDLHSLEIKTNKADVMIEKLLKYVVIQTKTIQSLSNKMKDDVKNALLSEIEKMKEICQERHDETIIEIKKIAAKTKEIHAIDREILNQTKAVGTNVGVLISNDKNFASEIGNVRRQTEVIGNQSDLTNTNMDQLTEDLSAIDEKLQNVESTLVANDNQTEIKMNVIFQETQLIQASDQQLMKRAEKIETSVEVLRSNDNSTALKLDQIMSQNSKLGTNDEKLMQKSEDIETNLGVLSSNDNQTHLKLDEVIEQNNQLESVNEEILDTADNIETKVEAVANATQESDERRDAKMELILGETQEISKKVSNPCPSDGMIGNNGVCYFPLLDQRRNATDAERACNDLDSRLADVDSKMTYEQLIIHLQPQVAERGWAVQHFTLGMTFNTDSETAYFRNGTEAAFTPWATGYENRLPFTTSQYARWSGYTQLNLRIQVGESVTSKKNGFLNWQPADHLYALCQRDVN